MYLVLYTDMDIEHQEQAYMKYLIDDLEEYAQSDYYPFHMPGHKRKSLSFPNPYEIDITEIDGFDNLHYATGMIKEAEVRGAELYHSKRCFFLVNGSTCGLLAAISAATRRGDKVLVARNCHKAVYHALYMNELQAEYLYPSITKNGIQGQITAEQVQESLYENPDAVAVILTSPTYEGIVSDVAKIAEVCHEHGIPLIVDEAHGAHFGFGGGFPENAVKLGADAVIMSLHKTLPSFTQTALLHLTSDLIDEKRVERYLSIYETSSPSYIFMAGMDSCIRLIAEHGQQLFAEYRKRLMDFYGKTAGLKYLHVMQEEDLDTGEAFDWDDSKLVIFADRAGMTGDELHQILLKKYHLQMEMVSGYYVLGMTSLMDEDEGLERLAGALHEIDAKVAEDVSNGNKILKNPTSDEKYHSFIEKIYQKYPREMQIYQAEELPYKEVTLEEAVGNMSADTIYLYPPGIPMIVPGEIITKRLADNIEECLSLGLRVERVNSNEKILKIVYF